MMKKKVRILFFDSDGVLLDMGQTIGGISHLKTKRPKLYKFLRNICIVLYAGRVVGKKLQVKEGAIEFVERTVKAGYKPIVVTRRPRWGLKRLEKQLSCFYGDTFNESNIFSSNLSRKKFKTIQEIIESFEPAVVEGFFIDDNHLNFKNLPEGITPIHLKTPDDFKKIKI